jgi:hypothetical protein
MLRIARLLTTLLALTLFAANSASAITAASAGKTASGLFGALEHRFGIDALASSDRIDEKLALLYDFASDFPVAARGCFKPCPGGYPRDVRGRDAKGRRTPASRKRKGLERSQGAPSRCRLHARDRLLRPTADSRNC